MIWLILKSIINVALLFFVGHRLDDFKMRCTATLTSRFINSEWERYFDTDSLEYEYKKKETTINYVIRFFESNTGKRKISVNQVGSDSMPEISKSIESIVTYQEEIIPWLNGAIEVDDISFGKIRKFDKRKLSAELQKKVIDFNKFLNR